MNRLIWTAASLLTCGATLAEQPAVRAPSPPVVAMYIHQHWPYRHPYAARTWSVDDWQGYMDGLSRLGFNTIVVWPVLETMPEPLTPSDRENIEKIARVIDLAHDRFGMRIYMTLSPNVIADSAVAEQSTFQERHFFHCDIRVNPAEPDAVALMMRRRAEVLRPLAKMDGLLIIDSDPGGYPGSTNAEFVNLLAAHRKLLDSLRPGIELVYWMWAGWPAYARYYETSAFEWGKPPEFEEALTLIEKAELDPWGIACTTTQAQQSGRAERVLVLQYGAIEGEPTLPMTNFGGEQAYQAGKAGIAAGLRGVVGNAQTHCVQLPNTFAFSLGATGKPVPTDADYLRFANDLIPGQGERILDGWKALAGADPARMRELAGVLEAQAAQPLTAGPLKGLLFGDPQRLPTDLALQLRFRAASQEIVAAAEAKADTREPLVRYLSALQAWYGRHGYQNTWAWQAEPLGRLGDERINAVLAPVPTAETPFGRVKESFYLYETFTPRLIEAIRKRLDPSQPPSASGSVPGVGESE